MNNETILSYNDMVLLTELVLRIQDTKYNMSKRVEIPYTTICDSVNRLKKYGFIIYSEPQKPRNSILIKPSEKGKKLIEVLSQ